MLAPLTALLVLQASLYQTIRSGIRKVISVAAGVLVAVLVSEFIGFSWWQLAMVIAAALFIGRALRLGDDLLEVPISAMLIFSSAGTNVAATGRVVDTLVGTAAGLAGGLVFAKPRVQPAREAVGTLGGQLASLLDRMAGELSVPDGCGRPGDAEGVVRAPVPSPACVREWLTQARTLRDQIERVDDTLRAAADSVRLNPRSRLGGTPDELLAARAGLHGGLETLEHATVTVRGLARSILDSAGLDSDTSPVRDEQTRARLADVLRNLAQAIRTYGRLVQDFPADSEELKSDLARQLEAAHREQDELAAVLEPRTSRRGRQQRVAAARRDPHPRRQAPHRPAARDRGAPGTAPATHPLAPGARRGPPTARPAGHAAARQDTPGHAQARQAPARHAGAGPAPSGARACRAQRLAER